MIDILLVLLSSQAQAPAVQEDPVPARLAVHDWEVEWAPSNKIYHPYLADPRQPHTGAKVQVPFGNDDEDNIAIEAVFGGFQPLALWTDPAYPDTEMQFLVEAAVFSRVDLEEGGDLDAADYRFGFPFLYRDGDWTLKFSIFHITSHLGDDYSSRTGRKRDSYHLNEFTVGLSYFAAPRLRFYGELGVALYVGPETESGRAQVGAEWTGEPVLKKLAPFVAFDFQARNEIDWHGNLNLIAGLMVPRDIRSHAFRATVEYYKGHDQQTQFKSQREHYLALGLAFDF